MGAVDQAVADADLSITLHMNEAMQTNLRRNLGVVAEAEACEVNTPEMAQLANTEMRGVIERRKALEKERKGFLEPASQIIERAKALFNPALAALERAEEIYKGKLLAFQQEEERRAEQARREAEEAARRARQEAEAKAAAERARAEQAAKEARQRAEAAAAEQRRQAEEAERQRAEGNARAAAEAEARARAAAAEQARQAEKERTAIENGEAKAASAQLAGATVVTVAPPPAPTQLAGFGSRATWIAEIEKDEATTIRAIAAKLTERPDLIGLLKLDMKAVGQMARALKANTSIPGIKVREDTTAVSRKG